MSENGTRRQGQRRGRRPKNSIEAMEDAREHLGHNGHVDRDALTRYVERIAALHSERKELNESIKEVYDEAKEAGFVTKIIRQIVREYQMDSDARASQYELLDQYRAALGMLAGTPLGDAAMAAAEAEY